MLTLFNANLTIFDGEGAMGGGNGNDGQGIAQPATTPKKGEFDNVVFGKQPENDAETAVGTDNGDVQKTTEPTFEERKKAYDEFIKANKDLYDKDFQKKLNRRFADHKSLQEKFGQADRLVGLVAERYGESNVEKLEELILNDKRLLEDEAIEKGMPVEQLIEIKKVKREADIAKMAMDRMENERKSEEQYRKWIADAESVKALYPEFDIRTEIQNPQFEDLLQSGVSMDHAYKVLHYDELMQNAVNTAIQKSAKATADSIAARGTRPKENAGNGSNSGVVYVSDVSKLTAKQREEIARRVAMGEKISF